MLVGCAHPRSSLRLAGARSSPDRVEIAYKMLGDDPDAGHTTCAPRQSAVFAACPASSASVSRRALPARPTSRIGGNCAKRLQLSSRLRLQIFAAMHYFHFEIKIAPGPIKSHCTDPLCLRIVLPVDKEIIPYRVNFATSRPLRAFKPPFSRAPTLQHQLPGSGEPSHAVLRRVVLVVSTVLSAFKNWATFGRRRNSALLGNMGTTGNTRNIATGKTHWEHGNTKLEAPGKPNGNMGTWEHGIWRGHLGTQLGNQNHWSRDIRQPSTREARQSHCDLRVSHPVAAGVAKLRLKAKRPCSRPHSPGGCSGC